MNLDLTFSQMVILIYWDILFLESIWLDKKM